MGREITVTGSQHNRTWELADDWQPKTGQDFIDALNEIPKEELVKMGFAKWNEESNLYLIPGEWYDKIPEGMEVVDINDKRQPFSKETHDDDTRYGCLAFGIILK